MSRATPLSSIGHAPRLALLNWVRFSLGWYLHPPTHTHTRTHRTHRTHPQDEYSATESARSSSVVEADFYHAAALLPLSDEQLVEDVVMKQMIPGAPGAEGRAGGEGRREGG